MLAESAKHLKVAVGQGIRYARFRKNWIRFGSRVELPFEISVRNSLKRGTHWIELRKTLHDLIKKIILSRDKANTVWACEKGCEKTTSQAYPPKVGLSKNLVGQKITETGH